MISNRIYMPASSRYFPSTTEGTEPVSQKRLVSKNRGGSWGLPRWGGKVGAPALSSFRMHGSKTSQERNLSRDGNLQGSRGERERMLKKSVCLFIYLPDSSLLPFSTRATSLPDTQQRRIPGVISVSSPRARVAFQFSSCIPGSA